MPWDAIWTFCEISPVAALCSSTAPAIAVVTSSIWRIAAAISFTASTALLVEVWMPCTCWPISSVAFAVCAARFFTSVATTENPLARFARARRLDRGVEREQVGLLGDRWIRPTTAPMRWPAAARPSISVADRSVVEPAARTAFVACST